MSEHTFVVLAYGESDYLEECIKSVLNQQYQSEVVIATSTLNDSITALANQYNLTIHQNPIQKGGIGCDFDFAVSCGKTALTTVAHQDDIYDPTYSLKMVEAYHKNKDATIIFPNYYELKNGEKVTSNLNLKIKDILLTPLKLKIGSNTKFMKRNTLRLGDPICCPAVTFVKENIPYTDIFKSDFKANIDWFAWEKLSREKGRFVFVNERLMGHRVHEASTTSAIIGENLRTKEDFIMFCKFWPAPIAKFINNFYKKAENSNNV